MKKLYLVSLTDEQRAALEQRDRGPITRRERTRVQILLRSDAGDTDAEIAEEVGVSANTVAAVRKRFAAGLEAALIERPRPGAAPKLDGKAEAVAIALACSPAPVGRVTWTARMLADKLVEMHVVESLSDDTVLRVLKKATSSRGRRSRGACPRA